MVYGTSHKAAVVYWCGILHDGFVHVPKTVNRGVMRLRRRIAVVVKHEQACRELVLVYFC